MKHPEFKLFPWGVLALSMPLVAFAAAVGYDHAPQAQHELSMAMLLSILAAGNAYIIAIAGGRLGHAVLSIPVGAAVGFAFVPALTWQPAFVAYILLVALACAGYTLEFVMQQLTDNFIINGLMLTLLTFLIGAFAVGSLVIGGAGLPAASPWAVPLCYPMVMASIGAAMVVRTQACGAPDGFLGGFRASLIGQLRGMLYLPPAALMLNLSGAFNTPEGVPLLILSHLVVCNYFTLRALFPQLQRVTDARKAAPHALQVAVVTAAAEQTETPASAAAAETQR